MINLTQRLFERSTFFSDAIKSDFFIHNNLIPLLSVIFQTFKLLYFPGSVK